MERIRRTHVVLYALIMSVYTCDLQASVSSSSYARASSSTQAAPAELPEKLLESIDEVHKCIMGKITSDPQNMYPPRESLAKHFRSKHIKSISLKPFPSLDEKTYTALIQGIKKKLSTLVNAREIAALLYLWSYLVGIPVVGLKKGATYYAANNHLLPGATTEESQSSTISLNASFICIKVENEKLGQKHRHIQVTDDLFTSVVALRKQYLGMRDGAQENGKIAWDLLREDLLPLEELVRANWDPVYTLLQCLTKTDTNNKPYFRLGLVNLLQNTAIYLSAAENGQGVVLASPCSQEGAEYFGFCDGLFLERDKSSSDEIMSLFGAQFYRRAFFTKLPCKSYPPQECVNCLSEVRSLYYPHYTFSQLDEPLKTEVEDLSKRIPQAEGMRKFARAFLSYTKRADQNNKLVYELIRYMNARMLKKTLTYRKDLQNSLFEPQQAVDLSRRLEHLIRSSTDRKMLSSTTGWKYHDDDNDDILCTSSKDFIAAVLEHCFCIEYQVISSLDLSYNSLTKRDIKKLGEALESNILPLLAELDLTGNDIGIEGLISLKNLLARDAFMHLIVSPFLARARPTVLDEVQWQKVTAMSKSVSDYSDTTEKESTSDE